MPKSTRSLKPKTPRVSVTVDVCEDKLSNLNLDDGEWKLSASLISPSLLHETEILSLLSIGITNGKRKKFTVISYDDVCKQISYFGNSKNKRTKDFAPFSEVCDIAVPYLESNIQIPVEILAKVIKFMLHNLRLQDIKKIQDEKKSKKESTLSDNTKSKSKQNEKKAMIKSIKSQEPPSEKGKSTLLKRGEEVREEEYFGDEPENGISRYVLLINLNKAGLLEELCRLHVDIHSIIRLHVQDQEQLQTLIIKQKAEKMWGSKHGEQDLLQLRLEQEGLERAQNQLKQFWHSINILMRDNAYDLLGNIATLDYNVKSELLPDDLSGSDNRLLFGLSMFDEIAAVLYDLIDFRRQWENYLDHIKLIDIPKCPVTINEFESTNSKLKVLNANEKLINFTPNSNKLQKPTDTSQNELDEIIDLRFYDEILDGLKIENTSVELILHAILEQVVANENNLVPKQLLNDEKAISEGLNPTTVHQIAKVVDELVLNETERKKLMKDLSLDMKHHQHYTELNTTPIILHPYDSIEIKFLTQNVNENNGYVDLMKAELNLLTKLFPVINDSLSKLKQEQNDKNIFNNNDIDQESAINLEKKFQEFRYVRYQQLLQFANKFGFSQDEFEHYLCKIQMECFNLSNIKNYTKQNHLTIQTDSNLFNPFDDPYLPFYGLIKLLQLIEENLCYNELLMENSSKISSNISKKELDEKYQQHRSSSESSVDKSKTSSLSAQNQSRVTSSKGSSLRTSRSITRTTILTGSSNNKRSSSAVHFSLPLRSSRTTDSNENENISLLKYLKQLNKLLLELKNNDYFSIFSKQDDANSLNELDFSNQSCKLNKEKFDNLLTQYLKQELSMWSVEEKLDVKVFLQRLKQLSYEYPNLDVYRRLQDNNMLIVSHHPFDRTLRSNHHSWSQWFHVAKLGFRPYLQLVESHIRNWTREQEAIYQANKLSIEIQSEVNDETLTNKLENNEKKKVKHGQNRHQGKRRQSPNSSGSSTRSVSPESLIGSPEQFIMPGSLKAMKKEQERIKKLSEEIEQQKDGKRSHSSQHRPIKETVKNERKNSPKKQISRNNSKSPNILKENLQKCDSQEIIENSSNIPSKETEYWPFTGYTLPDIVPHLTGELTHMFPIDGGLIKTQRNEISTGAANLNVSLIKDGHVFTIHRFDGPPDPRNFNENKQSQSICCGEEQKQIANQVDETIAENKEINSNLLENSENLDELVKNDDQINYELVPELYSSFTANFTDNINLTVSRMMNFTQTNSSYKQNECENQIDNEVKTEDRENLEINSGKYSVNNISLEQNLYISTPDGSRLTFYYVKNTQRNEELKIKENETENHSVNEINKLSDRINYENYEILLKMQSNKKLESTNSDNNSNFHNQSFKKYDQELTRYLTTDGILIIFYETDSNLASNYAIKILYPDGTILERGTKVAEQKRREENPKFTSDELVPETEVINQIESNQLTSPKSGLQLLQQHQQPKSASKRRSAKRKQGDKKDDGITNDTSAVPLDVTLPLSSSHGTPRIVNENPDNKIPWLVTLSSGDRFWLKTSLAVDEVKQDNRSFDSSNLDTGGNFSKISEPESESNSEKFKQIFANETLPSKNLEVYRAYDPATGQTLYTRPEDGLIIVESHPESPIKLIVQHPDGTRQTKIICSYNKVTEKFIDLNENLKIFNPKKNCKQDLNKDLCLVVRTECPGYPAVLINQITQSFQIALFGTNGKASQLCSTPKGYSLLQHYSGTKLNINPDNSIFYSSSNETDNNVGMYYSGNPTLFECIDSHKNAYTVDCWANCNVLLTVPENLTELSNSANNLNSIENKITNSINLDKETKSSFIIPNNLDKFNENSSSNKLYFNLTSKDKHLPRYFYFNANNDTISEFIHQHEFLDLIENIRQIKTNSIKMSTLSIPEKFIEQCFLTNSFNQEINDFSTRKLFLRESIQNNTEIQAITLLESIMNHQNYANYAQENIIPEGLCCRDFNTLNQTIKLTKPSEIKLGEKAGKCLDIYQPSLEQIGLKSSYVNMPLLALECRPLSKFGQHTNVFMRQFVEFASMDQQIRSRLFNTLQAFLEHTLNHLIQWCNQQPTSLWYLIQTQQNLCIHSLSVMNNDSQNLNHPNYLSIDKLSDHTDKSQNSVKNEPSAQNLDSLNMNYISLARRAAYETLRVELEKAARDRAVLRNPHVQNYFRSKEGLAYLNLLNSNMDKLAEDVPQFSKSKHTERNQTTLQKCIKSVSKENSIPEFEFRQNSKCDQIGNISKTNTKLIDSKMDLNKSESKNYIYYDSTFGINDFESNVPLDAIALARQKTLRVPKYLYAGRPNLISVNKESGEMMNCTIRNTHQAIFEDPVRRRVLLTSIIGGPPFGQVALKHMRGLRLQPCRISFGLLSSHSIKRYKVRLVNWGPETAHFRIKQPSMKTGIRVYYTPGPIPAGLSRDIKIEITHPHCSLDTAFVLNKLSIEHKHSMIRWKNLDDENESNEDNHNVMNDDITPKAHTTDSKILKPYTHYLQIQTDTHIINLPVSGQILIESVN